MKKDSILVICHLTNSKSNGQISKTTDIIQFLRNHDYEVNILNYGKLNLIQKVLFSRKVVKKYNKIVLMPGGKRALFFYTNLLINLKKTNIHYVAIGGWVLNLLNDKKYKKYFDKLKLFKGLYLQNIKAVKEFADKGFKNVTNISSFSSKLKISENEALMKAQNYKTCTAYNFCFFARVEKTKGILLACNAIQKAIKKYPDKKISFDIFGELKDSDLKNKLIKISRENPQISYKGVLSSKNCLNILSEYFCMLFPTYYHGEGTPHTIIESFMAALPVIASNWAYNSELIDDGHTGLIFELNTNELFEKICWAIENKDKLSQISQNCYKKSSQYEAENLLKPLLKNLN